MKDLNHRNFPPYNFIVILVKIYLISTGKKESFSLMHVQSCLTQQPRIAAIDFFDGLVFSPLFFFSCPKSTAQGHVITKDCQPQLRSKALRRNECFAFGKMQGFGVSPEKRLVLVLPLLLQFLLLTAFVTRCDGTPETACLLLMLPLQQNV